MKRSEAATLIGLANIAKTVQRWYDLGAGSGLFTLALAELLASGSTIWAVDKDSAALAGIPERHQGVEIRKRNVQFGAEAFALPPVDGILAANLLHFLPDQKDFLKQVLPSSKRTIIIEYEHSRPSLWEPHPIPFSSLRACVLSVGAFDAVKIGSRSSRFGGEMYIALIERSGERTEENRL